MKTRPILLVIITLIVGFVLGMLTSAQIRYHKLMPVRFYYSGERFMEGFYKTIEPDEKQKAEIDKILEKYGKINGELQSDFRKQLDSNLKEFRKEIDSKLTKEQLARLKEMDERRQEMFRQGRRDRDSSGMRNNRGFDRNGRQYPDNQHMRPDGRPMPPQVMPMPPRDSTLSPDRK